MRIPSGLPTSGVSIDVDLRAVVANPDRDRAGSVGSFATHEPPAHLVAGARCDLPSTGVQLALVKGGDGGHCIVGRQHDFAAKD